MALLHPLSMIRLAAVVTSASLLSTAIVERIWYCYSVRLQCYGLIYKSSRLDLPEVRGEVIEELVGLKSCGSHQSSC